ncbi:MULTISPECIES: TlpA family protein disulfide reductase [Sphingobacterium]|uniref:TlpA family protein disulfide reductase n=1 Tax=Sphingobacterium TaxID=28453 RepID=UPI0013DA0F50|nr:MULTISPECIES: TlpA disulfide reductase family protein [unclassified Sphingobacterium]
MLNRKQQLILLISIGLFTVGCTNTAKERGDKEEDNLETSVELATEPIEEVVKASFIDINNGVTTLDSLRGKVVVMNFWATWCPPCIREMPSLNALFLDLKSNTKIVFMAIDVDVDIKGAAKFMAKNKFDLPLYTLHTPLPAALETNSIPMTVILDKKGKIAAQHTGMVDFGNQNIKASLIKLAEE